MATFLTKPLRDLRAGDKILVKLPRATQSVPIPGLDDGRRTRLGVRTVTASSPGAFSCVDAGGNVLDYVEANGSWRSSPERYVDVAWTAPLPAGTDEEVVALASVLLAERSSPVLMWVRSRDLQGCRVVPVSSPPDPAGEEGEAAHATFGNAAVWEGEARVDGQSSSSWTAGDLVAAVDLDASVAEGGLPYPTASSPGIVFTPKSAVVVGNFATDADLGRFLPDLGQPGNWAAWIGDFHKFAEEADRAVARTQPDEALFAWKAPGECAVLATSGNAFFMVDDVADYFHGGDVEPGLWVLKRAKWWTSEGHPGNDWERDAGIDGDWEPASEADLERFGLSREEADAEIADFLDLEARPGLADEYMALSATAASATPATAPVATP